MGRRAVGPGEPARRLLRGRARDGAQARCAGPLPRAWQEAWARDFQRAYDALATDVDAGRDTAIDGYAAEAPEEFFAVCTEYHFSDPALLRRTFPDVAAHLARLYGPPAA